MRRCRALGADEAVSRLRADGLSNNDLETLVGKLRKGEKLSDVAWAAKYGDEVIYLSKERLEHILKRHSSGVENPTYETDFFPTGQVIEAAGDRSRFVTPNRMSEEDIPKLVGEVIENPTRVEDAWNGDAIAFTARVEKYGIETMEVRVRPPSHPNGGRVLTSWPNSGPEVWKFDGNDWRRMTE